MGAHEVDVGESAWWEGSFGPYRRQSVKVKPVLSLGGTPCRSQADPDAPSDRNFSIVTS